VKKMVGTVESDKIGIDRRSHSQLVPDGEEYWIGCLV
jgi:hypothetical protein